MTARGDELKLAADWYLGVLKAVQQVLDELEGPLVRIVPTEFVAALARRGYMIERAPNEETSD